MCGIFGWQLNGVPPRSRRRMAAVLAWDMDRRGGHSWGIYSPETNQVSKGMGSIGRAVRSRELASLDSFFAHTRYATTGDVTLANAHPFRIGGIVGAHNGMVSNHARLNRAYGRKCAVDSMHLFHHLDEQEALCEIEAYGAVEFVRVDQRQRIFLASFGGDLCVAQSEYGVVWASTVETVYDAVVDAAVGDWDQVRIEHHKLYVVQEGRIFDAETPFEVGPFVSPWKDSDHLAMTSGGYTTETAHERFVDPEDRWNEVTDQMYEPTWQQWN